MPSPKAKGLEDLFTDTLKDIYFAEKQILRALPKMAKSASSQELSQAFEKHREETEGHVATELALQLLHYLGKPLPRKRLTCLVRKRQKDFDEIGQRKSTSLDSKRSAAPGTSVRLKSWKAAVRLRGAITPLFG
jgi:hypothetical protein